MKTRKFDKANYKATYINGKTLRFPIDESKPILELVYPEFYDISITNHCNANCSYCYQDSNKNNGHYDDILNKVVTYFGSMTPNERPFQIAYGGGEPTGHPAFIDLLEATKNLGIVPNYTTNGLWVNDDKVDSTELLEATRDFCGGVAVSCHPHLAEVWPLAASFYVAHSIKLNFHIIISDRESIDFFKEIYDIWESKVDTFVLLPYLPVGRAKDKPIDYEYLREQLPENIGKIAFGANFYEYLTTSDINMHLYEPEMFSKYITLEDNGYMYPSSFSQKLIKSNFLIDLCGEKDDIIIELKRSLNESETESNRYFWDIDELEKEIRTQNDNLIYYRENKDMFRLLRHMGLTADNLYDTLKLEELMRLYKSKSLEELQNIK